LNTALSYTLPHLQSIVELELSDASEDCWAPLPEYPILELSPAGQQRFLQHLARVKKNYHFTGHFIVRSANSFPADCGLASSASSFAALTQCAVNALADLTQQAPLPIDQQAQLSRLGSGSSCRSFYGPFVLWNEETIEPLALPYPQLLHQVIVVDETKKLVSSSQAHELIRSSLLFSDRASRANQRANSLFKQLSNMQWQKAFQTVWQEFWDLHALFLTADPPFSYINSAVMQVLQQLHTLWREREDGPLITMDAGPNIHLLFRQEQQAMAEEIKLAFANQHLIIASS
jgi:diphosphomevalonate decarboxylase